MPYVVNFNSNSFECNRAVNHYGFWTGKAYVVDHEEYPICENVITSKTKVYKYARTVYKAGEKTFERFTYVKSYMVVDVFIDGLTHCAYGLSEETGRRFDDCYGVISKHKGYYDNALSELQELNVKGI